MLYELLFPLADRHIIFNVFQYISFRAAGAMVTALLLSFVAGPPIIRRLEALNMGQIVNEVKAVVDRPEAVFLANRVDGTLITPKDIRNILRLVEGKGV